MKELSRTFVFIVIAAASVLGATAAHYVSRPKAVEGYEEVGKEFYPDFSDPTAPKSMKVVVYNDDTAHIKEFEVAFKEGRWRIPSHHDYPADGKDRLAKTAASVIGIKREALVSRRESDHEKYSVLDPLNEDSEKLKGRGQRVVLSAADGAVLADYIIGKKVEGQEGFYYVRNPKEKATYKAKLDINLSTKFGDWIEADLLQLDADKLVEVTINKYSIDRTNLRFVDPEKSTLTRTSFSDPWKLTGINDDTEELKTEEVRTLVNNLDDLRIVGIRPKPQGLRTDLTLDPKIARNPLARAALVNSLVDKGFLIAEDREGNPVLVSNEGEVQAATSEGVEYVLYFGDVFTGSEMEIEMGAGSADSGDAKKSEKKDESDESKDGAKDQTKPDDASKDEPKDGESKKDDAKKPDLKRSRYLMVLARFDEARVGPSPTKPEKPEPPAAAPANKDDRDNPSDKKAEEKPPEGNKTDGKKPDVKKGDEAKPEAGAKDQGGSDGDQDEQDADPPKKADDKPADPKDAAKSDAATAEEPKSDDRKPEGSKPEEKPAVDPKIEYAAAMAKYKSDLERYENDLKIHSDKIDKGRKKADQLNKRFGQWYYVISAESFDSLRLSRAALVKPKEKPTDSDPADAKPGESKPGESKPDAPKSETPKPETPKSEDSKPGDAKSETEKGDAGKAKDEKPDAKPENR